MNLPGLLPSPGRWQRPAAALLFISAESVAWYVVLRAMAGATLRAAVQPLTTDVERGIATGSYAGNEAEAETALHVLRDALASTPGGPSLLVVLLTALGAFLLARWLARAGLPAGLGVLVGLLVSIVALQLLIRLALAGDLAIWDGSGLERFFGQPGDHFASNVDADSFVADPSLHRVAGSPAVITVAGLVALWFRFAAAGRREVSFERVLRSAGIGFMAALGGAAIAGFGGVHGVASYLLLYFVLAVLALSVAHAVRALGDAPEDAAAWRRDGPWAISVAATLGGVALIALLFGLLAALDVGRVLAPVGEVSGRALTWLLELLFAPVFWLVNTALRWIIGDASIDVFERASEIMDGADDPPTDTRDPWLRLPGWAANLGRAALIAVVLWVGYRLGRQIFSRVSRRSGEQYTETRAAVAEGGDGLFRRLLARRGGRPAASAEWLRRHDIYRLYGRVVGVAAARGLERQPGDTPLEFARVAMARLPAAPPAPFNAIALAFDRARYGRRFPEAEELRPLEQALTAWEHAHPTGEPEPRTP